METIKQSGKYNSFDIAKLVCSIMVVMIHVAPFGQQVDKNVFAYLNFGLSQCLCRIAVPLFFVFNGFFLYRKTPLEQFDAEPSKKYFLHILKLYLLWSLVYFPINLLNIVQSPKGILYTFAVYVRDLICVGSYSHLWYLNALLCAVALISWLLYKKWSPNKVLLLSALFYVVGLLGDGYYGLIAPALDYPLIGDIIRVYYKVFVTTRNGLFFAFFFVSLGMVLSGKEVEIGRKKAFLFFGVSMMLLCAEVFILTRLGLSRDRNILLSTVPAALFAFLGLKTVDVRNVSINARKLSSLIFYGHMWVACAVSNCLHLLDIHVQDTPLPFLTVVAVTVFIAHIVMRISETKYFSWLKIFY